MVETPSFIDLTSQIRRTETTTPTANQSKNKKKEKKEDSVNDEFVNLLTSPEIGRSTPSTSIPLSSFKREAPLFRIEHRTATRDSGSNPD